MIITDPEAIKKIKEQLAEMLPNTETPTTFSLRPVQTPSISLDDPEIPALIAELCQTGNIKSTENDSELRTAFINSFEALKQKMREEKNKK